MEKVIERGLETDWVKVKVKDSGKGKARGIRPVKETGKVRQTVKEKLQDYSRKKQLLH